MVTPTTVQMTSIDTASWHCSLRFKNSGSVEASMCQTAHSLLQTGLL
jgi:hypothetical protein